MKRRDFIKTVAAGVGGLSVLGAYGQDSARMRCANMPELNRYLETSYREGWRI